MGVVCGGAIHEAEDRAPTKTPRTQRARTGRAGPAMPNVEIRYGGDEEYRRLREIRDRSGVMWSGMLLQGAMFLVEHDLIGENAPGYLEATGNGDYQSRPAWLPPDAPVQRIEVPDRAVNRIQIDVALVGNTGHPNGSPDASDEPEADTHPATMPPTADAAGPDGNNGASDADATDTEEENRTAAGSEASPENTVEPPPGGRTRSDIDRETAHDSPHTPAPTDDPPRFPGGTTDGQ